MVVEYGYKHRCWINDEKREEIAFSGEFEMALEFANKETNKFWGFFGYREKDKPCSHKYPNIDTFFCPKRR
jgi:hypothetical protein